MEGVKTLWDLLQEMIEKRWVRYLVGVLSPLIGILLAAQALLGMQIYSVSGTVSSVAIKTDSSSGEYKEHLIALVGSTTHYSVEATYFTPTLAQDALAAGEPVEFWYEQTPLLDPDVVALQIDDASGTSTKYVSNAYTDPLGTRAGNLITAGVFVLLGLLALAAGIWLPSKGEDEAPTKPAQAKTGYGQSVVGPPRD